MVISFAFLYENQQTSFMYANIALFQISYETCALNS